MEINISNFAHKPLMCMHVARFICIDFCFCCCSFFCRISYLSYGFFPPHYCNAFSSGVCRLFDHIVSMPFPCLIAIPPCPTVLFLFVQNFLFNHMKLIPTNFLYLYFFSVLNFLFTSLSFDLMRLYLWVCCAYFADFQSFSWWLLTLFNSFYPFVAHFEAHFLLEWT